MTLRVRLAALLAGALVAGAARAGAAELTVTLDYQPAPACPDAADFQALVAARLGRDPFRDGAPDHVLVRIVPRGHALDGSLEWRDAKGDLVGEQTFPQVSADCLRLTRAMGFALAVQIELLASRAAAASACRRRRCCSAGPSGGWPGGASGWNWRPRSACRPPCAVPTALDFRSSSS